MTKEANWSMVESIADECTAGLFDAYGLTVSRQATGAPSDNDGLVAVVGFTGDEFRGSLAVSADFATIRASNVISASPTPQQDRDWAGELANQLLGRIKNRLVALGAGVSMGIPMVFSGRQIRRRDPQHDPGLEMFFGTEHGRVVVWIEGIFADDFAFLDTPAEEDVSEEEGAFLLF